MSDSAATTICYGDIIKLRTKSAHVEGDGGFASFIEMKNQLVLIVPPAKQKEAAMEAEFQVKSIRGDKPPANGTPLSYRQPFVLQTSDGSGYSLNNKTPHVKDVVSLQPVAIKGEMYVMIEKEGYTAETHVHDGDINVELTVVDSNRLRKTLNKTLTHYAKAKSDAPGGFVSSSGHGPTLTFQIVKVPDQAETRKFVKEPEFRRASQLLLDPVKADEVSEASTIDSPSRQGSIVATSPFMTISADSAATTQPEQATTPVTEVTATANTSAAPTATKDVPAPPAEPVPSVTTTSPAAPETSALAVPSTPAAVAEVESKTETTALITDPVASEAAKPVVEVKTPVAVAVTAPSQEETKTTSEVVVTAPVNTASSSAEPLLKSVEISSHECAESTPVSTTPSTTAPALSADTAALVADEMTAMQGSSPVHNKITSVAPPVRLESATSHQEDEVVDTACMGGRCAVM